jgi:hypothetical protein
MGAWRSWTVWMISALSIPRGYLDVISRSACPSWLDDDDRYAFAGHLDGVGVAKLVRSEPPTHTVGQGSGV